MGGEGDTLHMDHNIQGRLQLLSLATTTVTKSTITWDSCLFGLILGSKAGRIT